MCTNKILGYLKITSTIWSLFLYLIKDSVLCLNRNFNDIYYDFEKKRKISQIMNFKNNLNEKCGFKNFLFGIQSNVSFFFFFFWKYKI